MTKVGICKLCGKEKHLQGSHLLPAALYKMSRQPGTKNPNPLLATRKLAVITSKQVQNCLLCYECEQRFNSEGETYLLRQVHNGKDFPLLDRLKLAIPVHSTPKLTVFSGRAVGIDTNRLAYFALSVVWRASVHDWVLPDGSTTSLDLGSYQEPIRTFLLGKTGFPVDVIVVITACTDFPSQESFFSPSAVPENPYSTYSLLTRGIYFRVQTGNNLPANARQICCVGSPQRFVFVTSREDKSIHAFGHLLATAKPSRGLN